MLLVMRNTLFSIKKSERIHMTFFIFPLYIILFEQLHNYIFYHYK